MLILPTFFPSKRNFLRKHKLVRRFLEKKFPKLDETESSLDNTMPNNLPIWVFWYQGYDSMPELVRICFQSVLDNNNGKNVILVTKDNVNDYIVFPEHVTEKFEKGLITLTHYSDLLRLGLLAKHGGLWADATILVTKPIDFEKWPSAIFTIRQRENIGRFVTQMRWTGFLIGGQKANPVFVSSYNLLCEYHKDSKPLIDYLLIDYVLDFVYSHDENVSKQIDALPLTNSELYTLSGSLNDRFDRATFDAILSETQFFKLNRRVQTKEKTAEGDSTVFAYLKSKFISSK